MKKLITICSFAILLFACTRKASPAATPTSSDNTTDKATTTTTTTTPPTTPTTTTTTTPSPATNDNPAMIYAGHTIYSTKCTKCHGDKGVSNYTATRWEGILKAMAPKAKLTEAETAQVTAYVKANAKAGQP